MKKMKLNRTELIQTITKTILDYEMREETSHILWDWTCSTDNLIQFLLGRFPSAGSSLYIYIRQQGLEIGTLEDVTELCSKLGEPIYRMKIDRKKLDFEDFELTIGF